MGNRVHIARGLYDKLAPYIERDIDIDTLLEDLLFEVPDEAMEQYMALRDPVEIEVGSKVHSLLIGMAQDFGLTTVGLTVFLADLFDPTMKIRKRYDDYVARTS